MRYLPIYLLCLLPLACLDLGPCEEACHLYGDMLDECHEPARAWCYESVYPEIYGGDWCTSGRHWTANCLEYWEAHDAGTGSRENRATLKACQDYVDNGDMGECETYHQPPFGL